MTGLLYQLLKKSLHLINFKIEYSTLALLLTRLFHGLNIQDSFQIA
jgi:hypothetical protein